MIARVSGSLRVTDVPVPSSLLTSTDPLKPSTVFFTTSMPTPLPDTLVTAADVEKPGAKIREKISFSDISASGEISPFSTAFRRSFSLCNPLPSSVMSMSTFPPECFAERTIVPTLAIRNRTKVST